MIIVRPRREWSPENYYHIGSRGNWRDLLYRDKDDFQVFMYVLKEVSKEHPFEIASYCLMSNHFHLMLRTKNSSISTVMARINKFYADYHNRKYNVSGHLFEKRFYSKALIDPLGILEVSRYIHMNPVEAGIAAKPQNYKWSSFQFFHTTRKTPPPFFTLDPILDYFPGKTVSEKKRHYCEWMIKGDIKLMLKL